MIKKTISGRADMGVTIRDVARHAGVSISTVSRVLNEKGIVAPEKERRVLEAAEELQFVPSAIAQSLKQRKTKTIGLLASDFSVSFFTGVLRLLESGIRQDGYQILSANIYDSSETEARLIENMKRSRVDALIVNSTGKNDEKLAELQSSGLPILCYDRHPKNREFPAVYVDKKQGIYDLLVYFYNLGHRRICFISGPSTLSTNVDRQLGIEKFIKDYNIPSEDITCYYSQFSEDFGYQVFQETVYGENAPTAYITGSIALAEGIMLYCSAQGISIPRDVSLASFGTFRHANLIRPTLVHVDDEYRAIGEQLLNWIRVIIEGKKPLLHSSEKVIPARLVLGESSGVPRSGPIQRN